MMNIKEYDFLKAARKKSRALYAEERKFHKEHEAALKSEIRDKFSSR